jgi:anti-anti-sigma regulatory factor
MSWQITQEGIANVVVLDGEMGIQDAANFHQAVLPLAGGDRAVRLDASAAKSIHTSIMQILYALSQAVPDFGVTGASEDFRAVEARTGLSLARSKEAETPTDQSGPA